MADNIDFVLHYIQKAITESLKNEVTKIGITTMRDKVATEVYDAYVPYSLNDLTPHYERTFALYEECEGNLISNDTLELKNTREENGNDIVSVIEYGKGYTWGYERNLDEEIGPRPFMEKTANVLREGLAAQALKEGLKKRLGGNNVI